MNKIQKIFISLKMQSLEQRRRMTTLLIVFILPVAFWASLYYTAGDELTQITVPTVNGDVKMLVPVKKSYPLDLGLMAVAWTMAVVSFFSESGSAEKDRRLVLCGYGSWQILLARLILLTAVSLFTSAMAFPVHSHSREHEQGKLWLSLAFPVHHWVDCHGDRAIDRRPYPQIHGGCAHDNCHLRHRYERSGESC